MRNEERLGKINCFYKGSASGYPWSAFAAGLDLPARKQRGVGGGEQGEVLRRRRRKYTAIHIKAGKAFFGGQFLRKHFAFLHHEEFRAACCLGGIGHRLECILYLLLKQQFQTRICPWHGSLAFSNTHGKVGWIIQLLVKRRDIETADYRAFLKSGHNPFNGKGG
ncbi:hypothetical protein D3C75_707730 [compost metagenome]